MKILQKIGILQSYTETKKYKFIFAQRHINNNFNCLFKNLKRFRNYFT